jgi:hypothetical protein
MRIFSGAVVVVLAGLTLGATSAPDTVTWTGWFSDVRCATPRVKQGLISPNNPDCVKKCLSEGSDPVFISEQAKALFAVTGYASVKDDVGWRVELTGTVDEAGTSIAVTAVKRLELTPASCALPKNRTREGQAVSPAPPRPGARG